MAEDEPLVQLMTLADQLIKEGHHTRDVVAALLSCGLIHMIEADMPQEKAIRLFTRSAHFAYNQGEATHDPH